MENKKKRTFLYVCIAAAVVIVIFIAAIFVFTHSKNSPDDAVFIHEKVICSENDAEILTTDSYRIENGFLFRESIKNDVFELGKLKKIHLNEKDFAPLWSADRINKTSAKEICDNAATAYSAESDGEKIILVFLCDKSTAIFRIRTDENGDSYISKGYKLRKSVGRTARYAADPESANPLSAPYFTLDEETGEFSIKFSYLSSGFDRRGKYKLSENDQILTLCVTSSEKYVFEKCDGGYCFNAAVSTELPEYKSSPDAEPIVCFEDRTVFAFTGYIPY